MAEPRLNEPPRTWSPRERRVHGPTRRRRRAVNHGFDTMHPKKRSDPPLWALTLMRRKGSRRMATLVAALLGLALIVGVSGVRVARGNVGQVGVVRNGGPLDTRTIRQIIMPGQRLTYIGMF